MKLKNKILLAASGLLVLSGAAATTGAFAWFTATRTASVAGTGYKVQSNTTDLSIAASLSDGGKSDPEAGSGQSVTFDKKTYNLTDVSGDGVHFVKPVFDSNNEIKGYTALSPEAQKVEKTDSASYSYWIDITLTFTATGARQLGIFISNYTFSANTDGEIYKAGRVAFLNSEKTTLLGYATPNGAAATRKKDAGASPDTTPKYVKGTPSESDPKTSYDEAPVSDLNTDPKKPVVHLGTEDFTPVTDADFASAESWTFKTNGYIGKTAGSNGTGTLSVVERIWLEGTDDACGGIGNGSTNLSKSFGLDISFYGVALKA